jgi:HlyD family secretion protein
MQPQSPQTPATKAPMSSSPATVMMQMRRQVAIGLGVVALLIGGIGGWAATAKLSGAVVGAGTVVVDNNVKKVQHPSGGIVGDIRVREGDTVAAGDLVMRLDDTITRANLGIVLSQVDELLVRQSRLSAERDGLSEMTLPEAMVERVKQADVAKLVASERALFLNRRTSREGQKSQLRERLNQLNEEVGGIEAQHRAKIKETQLVRQELGENEKLFAKNLTPLSKITQLRREATRIEGETGQLTAARAQSRARIAETELQILQLDNDLRTEVTKELREIQARLAELAERRVAAEDQLKRVDIRAPQGGIVHQLAVHTIGGVINPSDPVMLIVPHDEVLVLEVKIAQQDIAQLRQNQETFVRFTVFDQQTTPELKGRVSRISADVWRDPQTNFSYYNVRIALEDDELRKLNGQKLLPGMPAEVYIQTAERTALSYAMQPLMNQIRKAFNER